jgi:hypothetical protein
VFERTASVPLNNPFGKQIIDFYILLVLTSRMSTVQELLTSILSPPCSSRDSQIENQGRDSTDNNSNSAAVTATCRTETFPANAYHFPPESDRPKTASYRGDDYGESKIDTNQLPERCQFMFSDGRQCTMARSDIHPTLCTYHSEREEQLFGVPYSSSTSMIRGARFDLPELYFACSDVTTPAGVSLALAQVIRLLAQRHISRQEAATFGHLAHVLLQSFAIARAENAEARAADQALRENAALQLGSPASAAKPNGSSARAQIAYSNRISTYKNSAATRTE